jgi:glycine hydroxymethyltransferase
VDPKTGLIDYDKLLEQAKNFRPKIIIAGMSCYARKIDYARCRSICNEVGALLMADMAHVSGLVVTGDAPSPFEHADIVTTTTHKMLRGPRAGVIFYRKGVRSVDSTGKKTLWDLESKINTAVFPGLQGGPHNNTIAAMAVAFKQALKPEFKQYCRQVILNAQRLSDGLKSKGYAIVTGGTDCHLVLVDLRPIGINGSKAEKALEDVGIVCNKNTIPGDKSALNPSGIRLGTPALTTRGLKEKDIDTTVELMHKTLLLAKATQDISGPKLVDFKRVLEENAEIKSKFAAIQKEVSAFATQFDLPGLPDF